MNSANVLSLVEQLEDNIEDLEESLEPVLSAALAVTTKKLPLLDKAKLYVVVVYAIESLLFCTPNEAYLRLHGVAAKEHPVFRELTRVKQYFEKIKAAEEGPTKARDNLSLNKEATGRFIKHALVGNEKYDLEKAEREAREKFLAKRKLMELEKQMKEKAQTEERLQQHLQGEAPNMQTGQEPSADSQLAEEEIDEDEDQNDDENDDDDEASEGEIREPPSMNITDGQMNSPATALGSAAWNTESLTQNGRQGKRKRGPEGEQNHIQASSKKPKAQRKKSRARAAKNASKVAQRNVETSAKVAKANKKNKRG